MRWDDDLGFTYGSGRGGGGGGAAEQRETQLGNKETRASLLLKNPDCTEPILAEGAPKPEKVYDIQYIGRVGGNTNGRSHRSAYRGADATG